MSAAAQARLRLGTARLPLDAAPDALAAAVAAANEGAAIAGLDPALNPWLLDAGKVAAFAAGLARLDPPALAPLAGRDLWLGWERLHLGTAAPTRAAAFAAPFVLIVDAVQEPTLLAHTDVPIDLALALARIAAARAALGRARAEVRRAEAVLTARGMVPAERLGAARRRRAAAAATWRLNARAWAEAAPADRAARAACTAAGRAAERTAMPGGAIAGGALAGGAMPGGALAG